MDIISALVFSGGKPPGGGSLPPVINPDDYTPVVFADSPIDMISGGRYSFDATNGAILANLPSSPSAGDVVYLYFDVVTDVNTVTIDAGVEDIEGSTTLVAGAAYDDLYYIIGWSEADNSWQVDTMSITDGASGGSSVAESNVVPLMSIESPSGGADVLNYRNGAWYEYDPLSVEAHDRPFVLQPFNVTGAGRWILRYATKEIIDDAVALVDAGTAVIDMSRHNIASIQTIADGATSFTIELGDLVAGNVRRVRLDNSANTSAIASITFSTTGGITWSWAVGEEPTGGLAIGKRYDLILECRSNTEVRAYFEDEA